MIGPQSGRRVILLSMPVEALLAVLTGRATIKLPPEIPPDIAFAYSYVDLEHQILKVAVTHDTFDLRPYGEYIKTVQVIVEPIVILGPPKPEPYIGDSLLGSDEWARLI